METTELAKGEPVDMKLEVVVLSVSDVDRAKAFYENLGWRLEIDVAAGDFRGVQMTPHNSEASIIFGKGVPSGKPGSADSLVLAVDDIDAARNDLIARGVDVSEVFNYGRERLAAPGDQDAASRPRMEVDASTNCRCREPCRAPPRDGTAP